jgi:replicative DNA helicase
MNGAIDTSFDDAPPPDHFPSEPPSVAPGKLFKPAKKKGEPEELNAMLASLNRQLPMDDESERGVLSGLLNGIDDRMAEARRALKAEMFWHPANRIVWEMMCELWDKAQPIDVISLTRALREKGLLDKAGGPGGISALLSFMPVSAHFDFYRNSMIDRWLAREGIRAHVESARSLMEIGANDVAEGVRTLLVKGEEKVFAVVSAANQMSVQGVGPRKGSIVVSDIIDDVQLAIENKGHLTPGAMSTGWPDFDRATLGLVAGDLFLIGARPKMGKTAVLNTMVKNMTVDQNIPTLVISMEMTAKRFLRRTLFGGFGIEASKAQTGFLSEGDQDNLAKAARAMQKAPLWIDEDPSHTTASIRALIREYKRKHDIKLVMLDYVQLVKPVTKIGMSEERHAISETMDMLAQVKKTEGVVIIALAQAKRGSEDNPGAEPGPKDFDGGSAMEKFVDYGAFIHRPAKFKRWQMMKDDAKDAFRRMVEPLRKASPHLYSDDEPVRDGLGELVFERDSTGKEIRDANNKRVPKMAWNPEKDWREHSLLLLCLNRNGDDGRIQLRFRANYCRFEPRVENLYSNNKDKRQAERDED